MARQLLTEGSEMNVNSEKYLFSTFTDNVYQLAIVTRRIPCIVRVSLEYKP